MKYKFFVLLLFLGSCQVPSSTSLSDLFSEYQYVEDLNYYLNENFNFDLYTLQKENLFIIPIASCTPCVNEVVSKLNSNPCSSCALLFIGEPNESSQIAVVIDSLNHKYPTYFDVHSEIYHYQNNIGKPSLLKIDGQKVSQLVLDYNRLETITKLLDWK